MEPLFIVAFTVSILAFLLCIYVIVQAWKGEPYINILEQTYINSAINR